MDVLLIMNFFWLCSNISYVILYHPLRDSVMVIFHEVYHVLTDEDLQIWESVLVEVRGY